MCERREATAVGRTYDGVMAMAQKRMPRASNGQRMLRDQLSKDMPRTRWLESFERLTLSYLETPPLELAPFVNGQKAEKSRSERKQINFNKSSYTLQCHDRARNCHRLVPHGETALEKLLGMEQLASLGRDPKRATIEAFGLRVTNRWRGSFGIECGVCATAALHLGFWVVYMHQQIRGRKQKQTSTKDSEVNFWTLATTVIKREMRLALEFQGCLLVTHCPDRVPLEALLLLEHAIGQESHMFSKDSVYRLVAL
ncbi:unnamed protein product [Soboliphyme baturini]|uniref:RT_RNaseH_2 domain-containing protein n=1 Tax=Soboliphyme baturini TaxID=241478 RepID=A0A183J408_9BILA|nr:unnamed protein product [Soboliphyme baturini]